MGGPCRQVVTHLHILRQPHHSHHPTHITGECATRANFYVDRGRPGWHIECSAMCRYLTRAHTQYFPFPLSFTLALNRVMPRCVDTDNPTCTAPCSARRSTSIRVASTWPFPTTATKSPRSGECHASHIRIRPSPLHPLVVACLLHTGRRTPSHSARRTTATTGPHISYIPVDSATRAASTLPTRVALKQLRFVPFRSSFSHVWSFPQGTSTSTASK